MSWNSVDMGKKYSKQGKVLTSEGRQARSLDGLTLQDKML